MTLDPPYELGDDQVRHGFIGWTEVADPEAPAVSLDLNGRPVPLNFHDEPYARQNFPDRHIVGVHTTVDFREALAGLDPRREPGGFLLRATLKSDDVERTFEYAVTPAWMQAVFGEPVKPRPVPPAHLQIRVAGAAAGEFCLQADRTADRIEQLVAEAGFAFRPGQTVLDFGCGPGRLVAALSIRHAGVAFRGSDIDPEPIAWASEALADRGVFGVNGHAPPLTYGTATFDLVYCISVFTHLPEDQQFAWLDELARVLKPGGVLLTTTMNPRAYPLPAEVVAEAEAHGFAYWATAAETDGLPSFYRLAYHTHDYIRRAWAERGFEVVRIGANDLNDTQDSVLLRRL